DEQKKGPPSPEGRMTVEIDRLVAAIRNYNVEHNEGCSQDRMERILRWGDRKIKTTLSLASEDHRVVDRPVHGRGWKTRWGATAIAPPSPDAPSKRGK